METFSEFIVNENLIYKVKEEDLEKFEAFKEYEKKKNGYFLKGELIFTYDKGSITVKKPTWQLMNVKRGY